MTNTEPAEQPQPQSQPQDERTLLMGLIYGVLHETQPVSGVEFAVRVAVCARLAKGEPDAYGKAVKRALVKQGKLTALFPRKETEEVIRSFLRAIRHARTDEATIAWLAEQFQEPQPIAVIQEYLLAAERALANNFSDRR